MYSLAAPRSCLEPFASEVAKNATAQSGKVTIRVRNGLDPVPTLPPPTKEDLAAYPFTHVDGGWRIFKDKGPEKIPSERPPNKPEDPMDLNAAKEHAVDHGNDKYYLAWQQTPHTK
ncbi:hypothetical protein K474DRAFT_458407 [Panus rudis PR-1116 ss-1]|nr:hypothetical protein K474DRAFT_458407 [Panus rudis PR-1116 ss-1]